jgi:integral membrane protein (TIGR01906 family)
MQLYLLVLVFLLNIFIFSTPIWVRFNTLIEKKYRQSAIETLEYVTGNKTSLPKIYNEREKKHMKDVKKLYQITLFILLAIMVISKMLDLRISNAMTLLMGLFILLGVCLLFFEPFFVTFHSLFFEKDSWRFNPEQEILTRIFNKKFWYVSFNSFLFTLILLLIAINSLG